MASDFPTQARVVVIGGGVIGCSVAYHLAKRGWKDVLLLERKELTCGTTWHAAGLIGQLRATQALTQLAVYTAELYEGLEKETGQAIGYKRNGSLSVACDAERFEEMRRGASMASNCGLEVQVLTPAQAKEKYPLLRTDDMVGAVFLPRDGALNPIDVTRALAIGARQNGVRIVEQTKVTGVTVANGRAVGVTTDKGAVRAEYVVNCAGLWGRGVGAMAGVAVPLHASEHFYVVTEPMPGLPKNLPVLREPGRCIYVKEDAGKLLIGCFEPVAKPWGMNGIPEDFAFGTLPDDIDHFQPHLESAMHRIPMLEKAGLQTFFNGPESFTPDDRYLLGEAPEVKNFFVAAGFNSIGIQSAGGAGKVLADWIIDGRAPMDLWDVDIRRMMPFQVNRKYLHDRTIEGLGLLYAMHWPFRQVESARGVRKSALHDRLAAAGACFGETAGWERANWFAPKGTKAEYEYSYGRQNWFPHSGAEHRACREAVALFDQSSFAKYLVQGKDAERVLNQVSCNDVAVPAGRVVYTQWLNPQGGIEADLTVTRLDERRFLVVTSGASQRHDLDWLERNIPDGAHCVATDVTSAWATLGVMGPQSRALLQSLTPDDLSNAGFPFGTSREIDLGYARVRATRITYVGELGFELYVPTEFVQGVYDAIVAAGGSFGLKHAGYHAMNSLRIEKAYRHWGHDIGPDDDPIQAGLGFCVAWDKKGGFIGRDALSKRRGKQPAKRLVQFAMESDKPLLYHNEPIWRDGKRVGYLSSGMFGHTLGRAIGLGYVKAEGECTPDFVLSGKYEIEIARDRFPAKASLKPMYDPSSARIKV
ncbi:MAG: FAD-dependent oxidoreductase [Alphaproteobacteria bacterium]|nr:FAD-dependent oxidoreductase [Alphaproteobacteria bacterium]